MAAVKLINNSYPFLKGTEFIVTGGDDGFWSRHAFHCGTVLVNGKEMRISAEKKDCQYIPAKEYSAKVFLHEEFLNPKPMSDSDYWEDYYNSPG